MKRKILIALIATIVMACATIALWRCHQQRYWPFSQASGVAAFLGTEFEMSLPETRRALSRYGCRLVTFDAYRKVEGDPKFQHDRTFSLDELLYGIADEQYESQSTDRYYMPSVKMRSSKVEGCFVFLRDRLSNVSLFLEPLDVSESDAVLAEIEDDLRKRFTFYHRYQAEGLTNSYTHFYSNSLVNAAMFVDRRNPEKHVFDVGLFFRKFHSNREQLIDKRGRDAFGE